MIATSSALHLSQATLDDQPGRQRDRQRRDGEVEAGLHPLEGPEVISGLVSEVVGAIPMIGSTQHIRLGGHPHDNRGGLGPRVNYVKGTSLL